MVMPAQPSIARRSGVVLVDVIVGTVILGSPWRSWSGFWGGA